MGKKGEDKKRETPKSYCLCGRRMNTAETNDMRCPCGRTWKITASNNKTTIVNKGWHELH